MEGAACCILTRDTGYQDMYAASTGIILFLKLSVFLVAKFVFNSSLLNLAVCLKQGVRKGINYGAQNETYIEGWEKKTSNLLIYKRLCKI